VPQVSSDVIVSALKATGDEETGVVGGKFFVLTYSFLGAVSF